MITIVPKGLKYPSNVAEVGRWHTNQTRFLPGTIAYQVQNRHKSQLVEPK